MSISGEDKLVMTVEAAQRICMSKSWLQKKTRNGKIPCVRFGRSVRYRLSDLDAFVASLAKCIEGDDE